jgi:two-component system response regulator FixJ
MQMPDPIVHVIDDDDAARDSLEFLLRTAKLMVATYASALGFLQLVPELTGGCIVTDIRMPDLDGIGLLKRLNEIKSKLPVIVITGHGDVAMAVEAMKLEAVDFLEKPFSDEALLVAVQSALNEWRKEAGRETERQEIMERLATLSPRENDVLRGLVAGGPNKVIAYNLGISSRTVEIYRANVMTKTRTGSLPELVRIALLAGILGR